VEGCAGFELITMENATAFGDDLLEISKGLELAVDERLIQDGSEALGRLQFRRIAGQGDEPDPIRHNPVRLRALVALSDDHPSAKALSPATRRGRRRVAGGPACCGPHHD
jgi:hypothetical protein